MSTINPEALFDALVGGKIHPRKKRTLAILHEICKARFNAKATDWTVASIGRESKAKGGVNEDGLRQARSESHQALIKAWKDWADAAHPAAKRKVTSGADDWIRAIDNVASRQLVFAVVGELERAKAEIRLLKKQLPNGGEIGPVLLAESGPSSDMPVVKVTALMRRACKRFIDGPMAHQEQLAAMGLRVKKDGDLSVAATGEVLLERAGLDLLREAANRST